MFIKGILSRLSGKKLLYSVFLPLDFDNHDKVSPNSKTAQSYNEEESKNSENGWDRLKIMFQLDDFGGLTTELHSIYQAGFLGFVIGAVYGGITNSRIAYLNFMENNQATAFKTHFDAKKKLQDSVTLSFAKGGFKWGWRLALFTSTYVGITTMISVYRGKSSIVEYLTAGAVTGAGYKVNLGLRGILVGGGVGTVLGGLAGGVSLLILNASGTTMEEVRFWQYKWKLEQDDLKKEILKVQMEERDTLLEAHDENVGNKKLSLDNLPISKNSNPKQ